MMIIFMLAMVVLLVGPAAFGNKTLNVLTASMYPTVPVGSLITLDPDVTPDELEPGDIITFNLGGDLLATHRLMELDTENQQLITKGDNNDNVDEPMPFDALEGKVVYSVPKLGKVAASFNDRSMIPIVVVYLVVFIILVFIPEILKKE